MRATRRERHQRFVEYLIPLPSDPEEVGKAWSCVEKEPNAKRLDGSGHPIFEVDHDDENLILRLEVTTLPASPEMARKDAVFHGC